MHACVSQYVSHAQAGQGIRSFVSEAVYHTLQVTRGMQQLPSLDKYHIVHIDLSGSPVSCNMV